MPASHTPCVISVDLDAETAQALIDLIASWDVPTAPLDPVLIRATEQITGALDASRAEVVYDRVCHYWGPEDEGGCTEDEAIARVAEDLGMDAAEVDRLFTVGAS